MPAQEEKCPHCGGIIEENDYPSGIIVPHCDKHAAYMQQEEVSGKCPNAPDSPKQSAYTTVTARCVFHALKLREKLKPKKTPRQKRQSVRCGECMSEGIHPDARRCRFCGAEFETKSGGCRRFFGGGFGILGAILIPLGVVIGDVIVGGIMAIVGFIFVIIGMALYNSD
jgi:hypothetical protein